MLGIGDDPIPPPPGPEARTGRARNEDKAIAVAARFMDFLLWRRIMNPDCATATLAKSGICEEAIRRFIRRLRRFTQIKAFICVHLRNLRISFSAVVAPHERRPHPLAAARSTLRTAPRGP